jgi:hypothetical protein
MRIRVAGLSLFVVVALTGCMTGPPETGGVPTDHAPSATPTAAALAVPGPAIDVPCAEAVDDAALVAVLDGTPGAPEVGRTRGAGWEDYPAFGIALEQVGAVECAWVAPRSDGGGNTFRFRVVVDAEEDYAAATDPSHSMADAVRDTVGDSSSMWCSPVTCTFDVLVGDAWISGSATRYLGTGDLQTPTFELLGQLSTTIAAAPRDPEPWVIPTGASSGWGWDCQVPGPEAPVLAGLRAAYDEPGLGSQGVQLDARFEPRRAVDSLSFCSTVAGEYEVLAAASFVVGGAWAVEAPPAWLGSEFADARAEGASHAIVNCSESCVGLAAVEGSLLIVQGAREDPAVFTDRLEIVVAAIRP